MEYIIKPKLQFEPLSRSSAGDFEPFRYRNSFADTSFSLLYSWHSHFGYMYCPLGETVVITGIGINSERAYIILREYPDTSIDSVFSLLCEHCRERGEQPILEYVPEKEIDIYKAAAERIGLNILILSDDRYSDYVYLIDDFVSISGSGNKGKRGSINYLKRCFPDIELAPYNGDRYEDCIKIFDKWCSGKSCSDCHFGCEKKAFLSFMEIYDLQYHKTALSYSDGEPLSFIVCEQINDDVVSCFYQKNAVRQRGLTYWLNREILRSFDFDSVKYLNLGEDMGLPGLAEDKSSLKPCGKYRKYTIKVV